MRHIVRKSKVHTINKLSREAKKLKLKKGSEEQIVKNKKKAERFVNELLVIKKLNDDAVSKYALQNEIPLATILNDVNTTLETRALARLAGHKFILEAVQSFRNKYSDWKLCITELLNELGTKYRGKKKSNEKKIVKRKIEAKSEILNKNVKRNTDIEEFKNIQSVSTDTRSNSEDDIRNVGYESNSNESDVTLEKTQIEKMLPINNNSSKEELKSVISSKTITKEINIDLNKDDKSVKPSKVEKNILETQLLEKKSNFSTNKVTDDINIELVERPLKRKSEHSIISTVNYKKKRIMLDEFKPVCETVDSFFMTADDKDYMSVYKPPLVIPIAEGKVKQHPKLDYQKPTNEIFIKGKKVTFGKKNNSMGNRRERRQQQVEEPVDTELHPSWEAKRKQKSLAKFEGKKITFNDQD